MDRTYTNPKGTETICVINGAGKAKPLRHEMEHSLLEMRAGNTGNSGHDLAISILTEYFHTCEYMNPKDARMYAGWLHHQFCFDFVAGWKPGWSITAAEIKRWVDTHPRTVETT